MALKDPYMRCDRCDGPLLGAFADWHEDELLCCLCRQKHEEYELTEVRLHELRRERSTAHGR